MDDHVGIHEQNFPESMGAHSLSVPSLSSVAPKLTILTENNVNRSYTRQQITIKFYIFLAHLTYLHPLSTTVKYFFPLSRKQNNMFNSRLRGVLVQEQSDREHHVNTNLLTWVKCQFCTTPIGTIFDVMTNIR